MKNFNLFRWLSLLSLYVIADPGDNSITFSKGLYRSLRLLKYKDAPRAYTFYLPQTGQYAFCINPGIQQDAPLATIQYNTKYHIVGFECLIPTVQKIFYDYGISSDCPCKLSVTVRKCRNEEGKKFKYYIIERPYV